MLHIKNVSTFFFRGRVEEEFHHKTFFFFFLQNDRWCLNYSESEFRLRGNDFSCIMGLLDVKQLLSGIVL